MMLLFSRVLPQMDFEVTQSGKPLLANFALVRFLPCVHHAVVLQGAGLHETLGANVTFVRTFARVRPHMGREVTQQSELLLANFASMRLLYRVHTAVVVQIGELSETLLAHFAFVHGHSPVCVHRWALRLHSFFHVLVQKFHW